MSLPTIHNTYKYYPLKKGRYTETTLAKNETRFEMRKKNEQQTGRIVAKLVCVWGVEGVFALSNGTNIYI